MKNGHIIDGSKNKPYRGSLIINEDVIEDIVIGEIEDFQGEIIDCEGYCIAPGFIDAHSHNDWFAVYSNKNKYFEPFVRQGITTQVVGNCGFSPFGFEKDTPHRGLIGGGLFNTGDAQEDFCTIDNWYETIKDNTPLNLVPIMGHGTARIGISGYDTKDLNDKELLRLESILREALDAGAFGISIGLMYLPGRFSSEKELELVAKIAKEYDRVLGVHGRAYSVVSTSYSPPIGGKAHNLRALEEMMDLALKTKVKMQYSHLIFVGEKTFKTVDESLKLIEDTNLAGGDVCFDIYPMTCGASVITVILPNWYFSLPEHKKKSFITKARFEIETNITKKTLGFGFKDIVVTWGSEELKDISGMTVSDIAKKWVRGECDTYLELVDRSKYNGKVIMYKYANDEIISKLSKHENCLYMTDAWVEELGTQNPATYGAFPKFIRNSREGKGADLETTIYKMSGFVAERFGIKRRGELKKGNFADITVFDYDNIVDRMEEALPPIGVEYVFVNGIKVLSKGTLDDEKFSSAGRGLRY